MLLDKIIAGALAIVWDIESAFVQVTVTDAVMNRTTNVCTTGSASATLTNCGTSISDALVSLIVNGVHVLNGLMSGLSVSGAVRVP